MDDTIRSYFNRFAPILKKQTNKQTKSCQVAILGDNSDRSKFGFYQNCTKKLAKCSKTLTGYG